MYADPYSSLSYFFPSITNFSVDIWFIQILTNLSLLFYSKINECKHASIRIGEMIFLEGDSDKKVHRNNKIIPSDFFEDMESTWRGRVKRIHVEEEIAAVEKAAEALSSAVSLYNYIFIL